MKHIILSLLFLLCISGYAQRNFNDPIQHKKFTQAVYLSDKYLNKTIVLHLIPSACKRCEGAINPIINKLRSLDSTLVFTLIMTGTTTHELKDYLNVAKFQYDKVVFDTADVFKQYVTNYTGSNTVPVFYRINPAGLIVNWLTTLGSDITDSVLFYSFVNKQQLILFEEKNSAYAVVPFPYNEKVAATPLLSDLKHVESKLTVINESCIAYIDQTNNDIIVVNKGKVKRLPKSSIEERGILPPQMNEQLYLYLKNMYVFHTIYLKMEAYDDDNLLVYLSVPKITLDIKDNNYDINYFNQACVLIKNIHSGITQILDTSIFTNDKLVTIHNNAVSKGQQFIFPVQKGWPVQGNDDLSAYTKENNPLEKEFYGHTPLLVQTGLHGSNAQYLLTLEPLYKKVKSGYLFTNPVMYVHQNSLFVNTGFSEYTYRLNIPFNNQIDTFYTPINNIFTDERAENMKIKMTTEEGYTYRNIDFRLLNDSNPIRNLYNLRKYFYLGCTEIAANDKYIYFLVRSTDDEYFVRKYSILNKQYQGSVKLPKNIQGSSSASNYSIKLINNKLAVYGVYLKDGAYTLYKIQTQL